MFDRIWRNICDRMNPDLMKTQQKLKTNLINDLQVPIAFMTTASHLVSKCISILDPRCTIKCSSMSRSLFIQCRVSVCVCECVCVRTQCNCIMPRDKFCRGVGCCLASVKIIIVLSWSSGDRLHLCLLFIKMFEY